MRGLVIEQSKVFFANKLPKSKPHVDEQGFETGEKISEYDTPVELYLNVQDLTDELDVQTYGLEVDSMKRINATLYDLEGYTPMLNAMAWVDLEVDVDGENGNYFVRRIVKTTNGYVIYLKNRSMTGLPR